MYALKRVKINKMSKKEIADALNEIRFLASIRHKNVVGFLEAFLENNETELCIVMEYCGSGDLAQKVERYKKKRQYIDEKVIWRYLIQALKALNHLHGKGICHRDLKVANTFLAEDGSIKIGDMNVSKRLEGGQLKTQIGTPYYMYVTTSAFSPPLVLLHHAYLTSFFCTYTGRLRSGATSPTTRGLTSGLWAA